MINRVVITGRLTRDPELRYTQSGIAVSSFTVAVDRSFRSQNGEREADFINCVIWRKSAENFVNFTHKGSMVGIDGRLQTRNYENQQGVRVYVTEIVVDNFALLESRSQSEQYRQTHGGGNNPQGNPSNGYSSGNNFGGGQSNNGFGGGFNGNASNSNPAPAPNNGPANSNPAGPSNTGAAPQQNNNPANDDASQDPFANSGKDIDISDDDLPF